MRAIGPRVTRGARLPDHGLPRCTGPAHHERRRPRTEPRRDPRASDRAVLAKLAPYVVDGRVGRTSARIASRSAGGSSSQAFATSANSLTRHSGSRSDVARVSIPSVEVSTSPAFACDSSAAQPWSAEPTVAGSNPAGRTTACPTRLRRTAESATSHHVPLSWPRSWPAPAARYSASLLAPSTGGRPRPRGKHAGAGFTVRAPD